MRRIGGAKRQLDVVSAIAAIVLAVGATQMVAGPFAVGVTADEQIQKDRVNAWLDNGWYVPSFWQEDGEPEAGNPEATPFVYAPAYEALAHVPNALLGNEPWDEAADSADAVAVRHLVAAAIGALTIAAVGAAVWLLTGSRRFGLWAAAGLIAVPRFTGHSFFNPKDVPAACGYTLLTLALLLALLPEGEERPSRWRKVGIAAALAGGIVIAAGTRLSLWVPFAISIGVYAALRLGQSRLGGLRRDRGADLAVGAGTVLGMLGIAALYPNVATTPVELLTQSISSSADYPYRGFTLTAGRLLSEHPPLWYLPVWLGATYPPLLGALGLLGAAGGAWALGRARVAAWGKRELGLVLVLAQAALLPLAVLAGGGVLYNGIRQHLYVLPAIAIFAGVGAFMLWRWAGARHSPRPWRWAAIAVLSLSLIVPTAAQTLLFPYNYTYVNEVAAIGGQIDDRWETDYWWASFPEQLSRVPRGAPLRCSGFLDAAIGANPGPELVACDGDRFDVAASKRGTDVAAGASRGRPAVWVVARNRSRNSPPAYCEAADDVTRWMWGQTVRMGWVLRCDPSRVPPLPTG